MKKISALLVAFLCAISLSSCGKNDGEKTPDTKTTGTETGSNVVVDDETPVNNETGGEANSSSSSCDSYLAYMECTYDKMGMDEDTKKSTIDQLKAAWDAYDNSQMEQACQQTIDATKQAPLVEGCELK